MAQTVKVMVSVLVNNETDEGKAIDAKAVQEAVQSLIREGTSASQRFITPHSPVLESVLDISIDYSI